MLHGALVLVVTTSILGSDTKPGPAPTSSPAAPSKEELANRASNPNSELTQLQFRNITAPSLSGFDGTGNVLEMQAIVAIKAHQLLPVPIISKLSIPITTLPNPVDQTGLSPIEFFAQGVFQKSWGSWGLGFTLTAPSNTFDDLPKETWQLGPAAAVIYSKIDHFVCGGVFQQSTSLHTPSDATSTNEFTVTPSVTYNFHGGWFAGYPDFDWTVNWKSDGAITFPIGLQAGKIVHLGRRPFSVSAEAGYNVVRPADDTGVPRWMIGAELTALFPGL